MKKIIFFILLVVVTFSLLGCDSEKKDVANKSTTASTTVSFEDDIVNNIIMDYKSGKVLVQFNLEDNNKNKILSELINYTQKTNDVIPSTPKYIIHIADKGDSKYDLWVNVYVKNESLYIQYIPEKMGTSEQMNITDEIRKSEKVTLQEFLGIIKNK